MKFSMSLPASQVGNKLALARAKAAEKGFCFQGDERKGSFEGTTALGRIKGAYTVDGGLILFVVDKPWLVPEETVRGAVERFME